MLKLWELPDEKAEFIKSVVEVPAEEKTSDDEKNSDEEKPEVEEDSAEEKPDTEEKSALFFSGFDSSGLSFLKNEMKPLGFKNFFAMSSSKANNTVKYDATLEPGAPIGVAVVCGDFVVGATGTVTAVDGKKMLAFGHPFSHGGNVNFFILFIGKAL